MALAQQVDHQIAEEDELRSQVYRLLARLLQSAPDSEYLSVLTGLSGDESELGRAISTLAKLAGQVTQSSVEEEYQDLFIGVGRGELVPFASYYLTGFLNEKPLAKLRNDMSRLGIARREGVREPEDHIASVCEMMSGLIAGDFDDPADLAEQKKFFNAHVSSWAGYFFEDLEGARASTFYAAVGALGKAFMKIEEAAFAMEEA